MSLPVIFHLQEGRGIRELVFPPIPLSPHSTRLERPIGVPLHPLVTVSHIETSTLIRRSLSGRVDGFVDEGDMPYPADELGAEMAPNARVWRVYMDEATRFDNDMIDRWNRSLDVLLVFVRSRPKTEHANPTY